MINIKQKGYGLIEIIVVIAIGAIVFFSVEQYLNLSTRIALEDIKKTEALYFAKSSLEQARAIRDENWDNIYNLTPDSAYHFEENSSGPEKWIAVPGNRDTGMYRLWTVVSSVQRDNATDNIVSGGGTVDENTLKITSNVLWTTRSGIKQIELSEYLTNFR